MGRTRNNQRADFPLAVAVRAVGFGALTVLALGLMGCAAKDYHPAALPIFMADGIPDPNPGPVLQTPADQSAARSTTTKPKVVLDGPALPEAADKAPAGESSKNMEELPFPAKIVEGGVSADQAIRACLEADPQIRAGLENIRQAQADLLTSSLPPNPTLLADFQLAPLTRPFIVTAQGGPPQTDYQVGYPIDWFLFGKRAAAVVSSRIGVDVSAADFADLVRLRVAATIAAYYDVLEAQALREVARADLDSLQRLEGIIQKRVDLGGVGRVELDRVRLAVLDSQREFYYREKAVTLAIASLRALMGQRNADPTFRVGGSLEVPVASQPPPAEQALAIAEQARPDVESLRRQLAKAEADVHAERTKAYPNTAATVGYTRQFQQKAIGFPDVNDYLLAMTTDLPLLNRNQGNIRKAQSVLVQAQFNLQAQLVALRAEIEQAVEELRVARINAATIGPEQLRTARTVLDRITTAYRAGGRPLIEVLDAQRAFRETYKLYIMGQSSYWHSLHRLNAAMGRQVLR